MRSYVRYALALILCVPIAATAQETASPGYFEEIVVTATKRSESLQDVPISVGVVSGDTIEAYDIQDLTDLQGFVPGLTVQSTFGNWAVRIRGIGSGQANLAFDSSVSIFKDGVYCGRSRCLEQGFLDVDRVEVARGPQGALFGKSTIAGAVSVMSARPSEEFEGHIRAGYETEYGGYTVDAILSGPLGEGLRGRFAAKTFDRDGYIENPYTSDDDGAEEGYALRATLEWDVSDSVTTSLKVERSETYIDGRSNQLLSPGLFGGLTADPAPEYSLDFERRVSTGGPKEDSDDTETQGATFTLDAQLGTHSLTAIASFFDMEYENLLDVDGVPEFFLNTTLTEEYEQSSFEVRLLSPTEQTFEYIVGLLYHTSETQTQQHSPFGFFPAFLAPVPVGSLRQFKRDTDTFSVYGQLTYNISDRFRIIADLRYSDEEQDAVGSSHPVSYPDLITPVFDPTAFNQAPQYLFKQTRTDDAVDPAIKFQFDVTDDVMVYLGYSTGSKPGGLKANDGSLGAQLLAISAADQIRYTGQVVTPADMIAGITLREGNGVFDFEDEEAKNIEVGARMVFADGRASLNATAYSMEFDNLQTSSYDGTRFIIANAASADITGLEVEAIFYPVEGLRLAGSISVIDAEYDDFFGAQCLVATAAGAFQDPTCVDGQEDLSGEGLERTPDWEGHLSADWVTELSDGMLFMAGVSMFHTDGYHTRQDFHPLGDQDSYQKWDVRLALGAADDSWEVALVGRNLTDEKVIQHAYEIAGSNFASISKGRMLTVEGTYRF